MSEMNFSFPGKSLSAVLGTASFNKFFIFYRFIYSFNIIFPKIFIEVSTIFITPIIYNPNVMPRTELQPIVKELF
jgi:hypothetical protein